MTLFDQLEERIKAFSHDPLRGGVTYEAWLKERSRRESSALFYLLGMLQAMTSPEHPGPTKTRIARAINISLDRGQPDPAPHAETGSAAA